MCNIAEVATAFMKTDYGDFNVVAFKMNDGATHLALVHGEGEIPVIRIQSHCLLGTAFNSKECDCGAQTKAALSYLTKCKYSILFYLDQEGRGYGLFSKIEILSIANKNISLKDAQMQLGRGEDLRTYDCVKDMLHYLGISTVDILVGEKNRFVVSQNDGIVIRKYIKAWQIKKESERKSELL